MLPGKTRSPRIRFCRAAKSGSLNFFGFEGGGGDRSAITFPFLTILTCWPSATQFITSPKARRSCLTFAVFMFKRDSGYSFTSWTQVLRGQRLNFTVNGLALLITNEAQIIIGLQTCPHFPAGAKVPS